MQVLANGFPHSPLDPVSNHSASKSAGTGEPDPDSLMFIISQAEGGKKGAGKLGAIVIHSTEILGTQDAGALGKAGYSVTSRR